VDVAVLEPRIEHHNKIPIGSSAGTKTVIVWEV
jgi:hypothetical protein